MSLLERVIAAHKCRSMHHYIALDALSLLQVEGAGDWKNLMLRHNARLFEGAKAPDAVFKDFQNHVLHVGEGQWGGARGAATEWYAKSVDALKAKKWEKAAYCLGVLSHYYADVCQPFHTGQTEEEGAIHRAVEWSIVKSVDVLKTFVQETGYPDVARLEGPGFISDMVLAAAEFSNPHYQTFIDHYDLDAGVANPPSGIDDTMFEAVAECFAYATAGLATVFTAAIEEAGVAAPKTHMTVRGYLAATNIPWRKLAKKLDDIEDRKTVEKMYREFQKTGKVLKTLPDDDKAIRKLHCKQVLRISLKELDRQELKPLGTKHVPVHGAGALDDALTVARGDDSVAEAPATKAKKTPKKKTASTKKKPVVAASPDAQAQAQAQVEPIAKPVIRVPAGQPAPPPEPEPQPEFVMADTGVDDTPAPIEPPAPVAEEAFDPAPTELEIVHEAVDDLPEDVFDDAEPDAVEELTIDLAAVDHEAADEDFDLDGLTEAELAELAAMDLDEDFSAQDAAISDAEHDETYEKDSTAHLRTARLTFESSVVDAPSIGKKTARRLSKAGITTVEDLIDCDVEWVAEKLNARHITPDALIDWQDQTMLMMEVPGLRALDVQILVGAGIRSANALAATPKGEVMAAAMNFLSTDEGNRVNRFDDEPLDEDKVENWIDLAQLEVA